MDLINLLPTFRQLPLVISDYIREIESSALDVKRNEEAWTIREHVFHISGVQKMLFDRIKLLSEKKEPVIEPYFPELDENKSAKFNSIEEALEHYSDLRNMQFDFIQSLDDKKVLKNKAVHPEYRTYTIPIIINHMIFHEYWHMYRIEEIWLMRDEYFN